MQFNEADDSRTLAKHIQRFTEGDKDFFVPHCKDHRTDTEHELQSRLQKKSDMR
jgi:hypothetical protein